MSIVSKLKNILFEEEEVEIPVLEKKEVPKYQGIPKKEEVSSKKEFTNFYADLEPAIEETRRLEEKRREEKRLAEQNNFSEKVEKKEMPPRVDKYSPFPDFDEEEFRSVIPKERPKNIMEYERKPEKERVEYKRVEKERVEKKEDNKPKFKPSPIISPVYGILDKNYTPDDITSRTDNLRKKDLDVDSVRKKAFGTTSKPAEEKAVKKEKTIDNKILEERLEKARTIDELLKDSSDEVIEVRKEVQVDKSLSQMDSLEDVKLEDKMLATSELEDSLESDLFDLIDSMYENREDGE